MFSLTINLQQLEVTCLHADDVTSLIACNDFWLLNKEYFTNLHKCCVDW